MIHNTKPSDIYKDKALVEATLWRENLKVIGFRKPKTGERFIRGSWPTNYVHYDIETQMDGVFTVGPRLIVESKCSDTSFWE